MLNAVMQERSDESDEHRLFLIGLRFEMNGTPRGRGEGCCVAFQMMSSRLEMHIRLSSRIHAST